MINFFKFPQKINAMLFCVFAGFFLQGCDKERTTPFTPILSSSSCSSSSSSDSNSYSSYSSSSSSACSSSSSSSSSLSSSSSSTSSNSPSSSSSSVANVNVYPLPSGEKPATTIIQKEKNIQYARDQASYDALATAYAGKTLDTQDFVNGQVVLVDMGEINTCVPYLSFLKLEAQVSAEDTVKVSASYLKKSAEIDSCSTNKNRPYYFYYVQSRSVITLEEIIIQ